MSRPPMQGGRQPRPPFMPRGQRPPYPQRSGPPPDGPRPPYGFGPQRASFPSDGAGPRPPFHPGSARPQFGGQGSRPPFAPDYPRPPPPNFNIDQRPPFQSDSHRPPFPPPLPTEGTRERFPADGHHPPFAGDQPRPPFYSEQGARPPYPSNNPRPPFPTSAPFNSGDITPSTRPFLPHEQDFHSSEPTDYNSIPNAAHTNFDEQSSSGYHREIPSEGVPPTGDEKNDSEIDKEKSALEKAKKQREADQDWVRSFVSSRCQRLGKPRNQKSKAAVGFSIREAQGLLREALMLKKELATMLTLAQSNPNALDYVQSSFMNLKQRLKEIETTLSDEENVAQLQRKLSQIQKKRSRQRRHRQLLQQEREDKEKRRQEIGAKIDQWQAAIKQKNAEAKKTRELKKEADSILGEVRRKQTDGKRCQDLLKALVKLRDVRKDKAERRGQYLPQDVDDVFNERLHRLEDLWERQLQVYQEEQQVLEVMMEVEHEETKEKEMEKVRKKDERMLRLYKRNLKQCLFGADDVNSMASPLYPYRQFYESADHSVENLVRIRQEWDMYLTSGHTSEGSSIPIGWVTPPPPSGPVWSSALSHKDS